MSIREQQQQHGVIGDPESGKQQQTLPPKWIGKQEQTLPPKWIENILTDGHFLWFVLSVIVDPLFFYVPVINEERKCVALGRRLYISITCLRTVLDSILLARIIVQCRRHFANACQSQDRIPKWAEMTGTENLPKLLKLLLWLGRLLSWYRKAQPELWSLPIDVLAILPIPQVLLPIVFSKLRGSESLNKIRKVLTAVVLFQYLPRALLIYLLSVSWRKAFSQAWVGPSNVTQEGQDVGPSKTGQEGQDVGPSKTGPSKTGQEGQDVGPSKTGPSKTGQEGLDLGPSKSDTHEGQNVGPSKSVIAVKAGLNLFMFIVASHILGGFWYFFSIERERACWHLACENHIECNRSSFDCNDRSVGNYTFLNDYCPIQTPNTTAFDFGIFQGALQSGTVASMDFPRKILYCFWWGLRNLSSFGSNLQTSPHFWENCFAVLTSISGLLLFMYFLGRLQMYMQWEGQRQLQEAWQRKLEENRKRQLEKDRERQLEKDRKRKLEEDRNRQLKENRNRQLEENRKSQLRENRKRQEEAKQLDKLMKRWKSEMKTRKRTILEWIDRQPRLKEIRKKIIDQVDRMFTQEENRIKSLAAESIYAAKNIISRSEHKAIVDAENPLPHFPPSTRREIQQLLCLPLLQKVPHLQNDSDDALKLISCDFLKQVYYNENSYIVREGEPLDALLFITRGIVWSYTTSPDHRQNGCLKTDDFYGVELLEWVFNSPSFPDPSNLPFSTRTLRCHTKVEAFALTVGNIQDMLYQHWWKFSKFRVVNDSNLEQREGLAASKVQAAFST